MSEPRLIDAVTLRNFGIVEQLSVIEAVQAVYPPPYWTEAVRSEILAGIGRPDCDNVLATSFLGTPHKIEAVDLPEVLRMQIALNYGITNRTAHLGEAESIRAADRLNGTFVTDDYAAYDFARRRLGHCRVYDTVELLRESVSIGHLTTSEARLLADAIRNTGRRLRRGHPATFTPNYFEPTSRSGSPM
jgi:hypothetical protein